MNTEVYYLLSSAFSTDVPEGQEVGFQRIQFAERQYTYWTGIMGDLLESIRENGIRGSNIAALNAKYTAALVELKVPFINAIAKEQGDCPPFIADIITLQATASENPFAVFVCLTTEIHPWIQNAYTRFGNKNFPINEVATIDVEIERTKYLIARSGTEGFMGPQARSLVQSLHSQAARFDDLFKLMDRQQKSALDEFGVEAIGKLEQQERVWSEKFEAFKAANDEADRIKKPVDLWGATANKHRKNFRNGIIFLSVTFLVCVLLVIFGLGPLMKSIGLIEISADKPVSFTPASTLTLATLIALITAAGFILKLAGRLVTNSLTLAEDAEIRSALADTYLGLTAEEGGATTEARDKARTVMLAALFRPLPGHQQEEISAPTVVSLAQEMLTKKGA